MIRAPLETCLVVQGGPGTGKTAVGLHRAAFLLYEHRELLDGDGVLVIGPNPVFLRYIAQVLPSLGETAVRQTTVERLVAGGIGCAASTRRPWRPLKGDARMATVLERAVGGHDPTSRPTTSIVTHRLGPRRGSPVPTIAAAIVEIARARDVPHNVGRDALRTQLVRLAEQDIAARRGDDAAPSTAFDRRPALGPQDFQSALGRIWPAVRRRRWSVRGCSSNRHALAAAAAGRARRRRAGALAAPQGDAARSTTSRGRAPISCCVDEAEALVDGVRRDLRARRRRRGPGPHRDGAAGAGPPVPAAVDDRARRPRAGHRGRRPDAVGGCSRTYPHRGARAARREPARLGSGGRLSGARPDPRLRQPPAAGRRARCAPLALGSHRRRTASRPRGGEQTRWLTRSSPR